MEKFDKIDANDDGFLSTDERVKMPSRRGNRGLGRKEVADSVGEAYEN